MEPLVSVVIPVYCASDVQETFLSEALASVAQQTFREFEVIVVDDASPRDIGRVIAAAGTLPSLRIIRNETNVRHAASRNVGVRAAGGEFVAFLDHDDMWLPDKLERQVESFQQHPEAALVFCEVDVIGDRAGSRRIDQSRIPDSPDFEWFMRHGNHILTASAVMVKRAALEEIGLFDTRFTTSDDLDAWLKIARRWPIIHLRECLACYRLHGSNVNYSVDRLNDTGLLFPRYLDYFLRAPATAKLRLLKPMARKICGQIYFRLAAGVTRTRCCPSKHLDGRRRPDNFGEKHSPK